MQRNRQLQLDVEAPFGVESAAVEVPCLVVVVTHELRRLSNIYTGCRISQGRAYSKKQDGLIGQQLSAIITTGSNRRSSHNLRSYNFARASAWLIKRIIHYSTLLMFAVPSLAPILPDFEHVHRCQNNERFFCVSTIVSTVVVPVKTGFYEQMEAKEGRSGSSFHGAYKMYIQPRNH